MIKTSVQKCTNKFVVNRKMYKTFFIHKKIQKNVLDILIELSLLELLLLHCNAFSAHCEWKASGTPKLICKKSKKPSRIESKHKKKLNVTYTTLYTLPAYIFTRNLQNVFITAHSNIACKSILTQACESPLRLPSSSPPLNRLKQPVAHLGC